jgi:uncharacterized membrane protein HdeD (DUF308 family)
VHGAATGVLSALLVIIGLVMLVRTATLGGGSVGYLFGVLFVAAGAARLYLLTRSREGEE